MTYRAVPGRVRVLALAALLVLSLLAAPGAVGSDAVDSGAGDRVAGPLGVAIADTDNETTRHRNPSEYNEGGDQEGLAAALERQLRRQLGQGAIELSEGEYDLASDYVGESFQERFSDYADVAGDTGREEQANDIETAREEQQNLTEARQAYEETREEYETAREAGDDERARELARELDALAGRINASSASLADRYGAIGEDTGTDFQSAAASVESVNNEVQSTQAEIRDAEFEETTLSIAADSETISYSDPLIATGILETADGEPIGGETIRLDVGNQTLSVATDVDGSFTFVYRPISVPASADEVSVAYVPEGDSIYLGSETSVAVSIEQVAPTISEPRTDAESVAFGDEFGLESAVTVDGDPVGGVALSVRVGGESLGRLETEADGTLAGSVTVPASVPDGEQELTVALPFQDRALAEASASTTVTVTETTPDLSVAATETGGELAVNGSLAADGDAIANHSVAIAVDGEPITAATTDAEGRYGAVAAIPDSASGDVTVTASLSGSGSNLAPAETSETVTVPGQGSSGWSVFGVPVPVLGGLGVVLLAGVGWWLWRRTDAETAPEEEGVTSTDTATASTTGEETRSTVALLLSRARDAAGTGRPEEAIQTAYGAVRRSLSPDDDRGARTHWEFYRTCESETDAAESLRELTEDYERATFDPAGADRSTAERALSRAEILCDAGGRGEESPNDVSGADD